MMLNRDRVLKTFRDHVLNAFDQAAHQTFKPGRNDAGSIDADLPRLFKAIDDQVEVLALRYHAHWRD